MKKMLAEWPGCFVCGSDNKQGLQVKPYYEDGKVKVRYKSKSEHAGYNGIIHGGIISALLDEVMVWAPMVEYGRPYFTGEMTIRFSKPLKEGVEVTVIGRIVKSGSKICLTEAEIIDDDGTVYASATGKYFPVPEEMIGKI